MSMKMTYFLLLALFSGLTAYFAAGHYSHRAPPDDKALKSTPKGPSSTKATAEVRDRTADMPQLPVLWEKNIFDPDRGGVKTDAANVAQANMEFELVGICKYGDTAGAIIIAKNKGAPAVQAGTPAQPGTPPGAATAKSKAGKKSEKRFFKKGEQLANGFVLDKINSDSVILCRGNEEIVLRIEFGDPNSAKRIASATHGKPGSKTEPPQGGGESKPAAPAENSKAPFKPPKLPKPPQAPPMMKSAQNTMSDRTNFNKSRGTEEEAA